MGIGLAGKMVDLDKPIVLWYRDDLRVGDNSALAAAAESGRPVIGLYIGDGSARAEPGVAGAASRYWVHRTLEVLADEWRAAGLVLAFRRGRSEEIVPRFLKEVDAAGVYWNRCYDPVAVKRDGQLKRELRAEGYRVESFKSRLLFEPHTVETAVGNPYKVFTPFWRAVSGRRVEPPVESRLEGLRRLNKPPDGGHIEDLGLVPDHPWREKIAEAWKPGAAAAEQLLERFLEGRIRDYGEARDLPSVDGTSGLSPYLAVGAIGPRTIWEAIRSKPGPPSEGDRVFRSEIGWREFAHHVLFHFPETLREPLSAKFGKFPWVDDPVALRRWERGETGYPIVDAGMRQLWETGWMHNRVRMIVGSLLVKHLLISWTEGEAWFRDTLVDFDIASNVLGWQWIGGCGADAAPYFRIFNPITQGQKFDPEGDYVRRWVPELKNVSKKWIHCPWDDPGGLPAGYPKPVIGHTEGRNRALAAFAAVKEGQ